MRFEIIDNINKDKKLKEYLINNSYWYRLLNRNPLNYEKMLKKYKEYKNETMYKKIDNVVENVELISNIMKFVD